MKIDEANGSTKKGLLYTDLRDGIRVVEIIERWRAAGQKQEETSTKDPAMQLHYQLRKHSSKLGPMFRPDISCLPPGDQDAASENNIIEQIINILKSTAHNWGDFVNGRLKSTGVSYARYVMAIHDLHRTTMIDIRKSQVLKPLFERIEWEIEKLNIEMKDWDEDDDSEMEVDGDSTKEVNSLVPLPHLMAGLSEQDIINQELLAGLQSLKNFAEKYGTFDGLKSSHIIQGTKSLAMVGRIFRLD